MYNILKIYNPGGAENYDELWQQNSVYVIGFGSGLLATAATFYSQDKEFGKYTPRRDFFFHLTHFKRDLREIANNFGIPIGPALALFLFAAVPGMPFAYALNLVGGWLLGAGIGFGYGTTVGLGGIRAVNTGKNAYDKFAPKKKKREQLNNLLDNPNEEEEDGDDEINDRRREQPDSETSQNPEIKNKQDQIDKLQQYIDKLQSRRNSIFVGENNSRTDFEVITPDDIAFEAFNDAKAFLDNTFDENDDLSNYIWENLVAKLKVDHNGTYDIDRSRLNEPDYWVNDPNKKDECIKLGKAYLSVINDTIEKSKLAIEKLIQEIDNLKAAEPQQTSPRPKPRQQPKPKRQDARPNRFGDSETQEDNKFWESFKHNFEIIRQGAEGELKKVLEYIQYHVDEYFESSIDYRTEALENRLEEPKTLNGAIKKYLSFSDRPENLASGEQINQIFKETLEHPSAEKYADELLDLIEKDKKDNLDLTVSKIKTTFNKIMTCFDLIPSQFSISDSWAYWDVAKQIYMEKHPEESNTDLYNLGDPITQDNVREDIIYRRIGLETYNIFNDKNGEQNKQNLEKLLSEMSDADWVKDKYDVIIQLLNEKPLAKSDVLSSYKLRYLGELMFSAYENLQPL